MINEMKVGQGEVFLIAGGGKTYCDVAAKFCRTEQDVEKLIASPQSKQLIKALINSGHKAALEFDQFIFGIQGYSRVTEVQMVRKRHASYMISSGPFYKNGKRGFNVVIPEDITGIKAVQVLDPKKLYVNFEWKNSNRQVSMPDCINYMKRQLGVTNCEDPTIMYEYDYKDILNLIDDWYTEGVMHNIPEEDLRYMKPQATEFKAAVMMNATALRDWARIRMCNRAQTEIRDLCTKMVHLAKEAAPELMEGVGPSCVCDGYCSEMEQCEKLRGKIPTKKQALDYINSHKKEILEG